jgi:peptide deformylase
MAPADEIVIYPNDVLRQVCAPIGGADAETVALAERMLELMYASPGRGLAGPQVGVPRRLFVMDASWKVDAPSPEICIDPELVWSSPETCVMQEGCLSLPDQPRSISRPVQVRMVWTDATGNRAEHLLDGVRARIAQHELDHLDGVLILDHPAAAAPSE